MRTMPRLPLLLAVAALALALQAAHANDSGPSPSAPTDNLAAARAQIAANNWRGAIDELQRVHDTSSADWNNLMGYSLRKQATPDLQGSERYYDAALRIDPKHRGTLEYSGELYLMKGDVASAEQRLATLEKVCSANCPEYTDLKAAIERYRSNKGSGKAAVSSTY